MTSSLRVKGRPELPAVFTEITSVMNLVQYTEYHSFVKRTRTPAGEDDLGSEGAAGVKALDQARRRRVVKPPDQRRREILEAATELFGRHGYDVTTVQTIATTAGVAAGTVYLYFPSKEAILEALRDDFEAGLLDRVAAVAAAVLAEEDASGEIVSYQEVVERLIDGMVAYSLENRAATEVLARNVGRDAAMADPLRLESGLNDVLSRVTAEGIRLGYVHTTDPQMTSYLLNLAAATAIGHAIAFHDDEMLERVVAQAKELYIKALAPLAATPD
jgi:AcrR family transcriptional regulator